MHIQSPNLFFQMQKYKVIVSICCLRQFSLFVCYLEFYYNYEKKHINFTFVQILIPIV